jgi:hypothetical protein
VNLVVDLRNERDRNRVMLPVRGIIFRELDQISFQPIDNAELASIGTNNIHVLADLIALTRMHGSLLVS